jgi:hypothetical protein
MATHGNRDPRRVQGRVGPPSPIARDVPTFANCPPSRWRRQPQPASEASGAAKAGCSVGFWFTFDSRPRSGHSPWLARHERASRLACSVRQASRMAERKGFSKAALRSPNEYGLVSRNRLPVNELALAAVFVGLHPVAFVFGCWRRNVTRKVTGGNALREGPPGRHTAAPSETRYGASADADLRFKDDGASGTLNLERKSDEENVEESRHP